MMMVYEYVFNKFNVDENNNIVIKIVEKKITLTCNHSLFYDGLWRVTFILFISQDTPKNQINIIIGTCFQYSSRDRSFAVYILQVLKILSLHCAHRQSHHLDDIITFRRSNFCRQLR